jgi:hypothetical protein
VSTVWEYRDAGSGAPGYLQRTTRCGPSTVLEAYAVLMEHLVACPECLTRTDGGPCPAGTVLGRTVRDLKAAP